jgi:PAS domain S-box-containing protein
MSDLLVQMPRAAIIPTRNREVARDLLVVGVLTGLTFVLSAAFELREYLTELTRPLERYQLDELPVTLAAFTLLLAWFSWRRWRQAAHELGLRVQAQRALADNENRYRTLFMENLAGNALCTRDGTLLLCNPAMARMLGLSTPESARGRNLFDFYEDPIMAAEHRALLACESRLDIAMLGLVAADGAAVKAMARMLVREEPGADRTAHVYLADISELQLMQRELADALSENRLLSQKYLLAQEEERRHLARELHDEMGQSLNAIKLDAVAIRKYPSELPREVLDSAQSIIEISSRVYDVARGLMERLRPVALDELGLADALQHLIAQWQRRNPELACSVRIEGELDGLGEQINITLYRVIQECLTNITRHARASRAHLLVERKSHASALTLHVMDDGVGMDPVRKKPGGLGLLGLRERVEALGGRLEVATSEPRGVEVRVCIPLPGAQP